MLIVYGRYTFSPKVTAYRADVCLPCNAERISHQVRTFDVLHVFWIPLIPIGFWKRWICSVCGNDPHTNTRTRRGFKIAGAVLLAFMSLAMWAVPASGDDAGTIIAMRIGAPILLAFTIWSITRQKPEPSLAQRLAKLAPLSDPTCRICGAALILRDGWICSSCGVRRM